MNRPDVDSWSMLWNGMYPWQFGQAMDVADKWARALPEVDWCEDGDMDFAMQQVWAIGLGHSEMPKFGFKRVVSYEPLVEVK